jgi:nucleoside-triphosphatase
VSKYGVDVKAFERIALPEIEEAISGKNLLIIDEIGKMELFSQQFRDLILVAFESKIPIVATILYKPHPFCDRLKNMEYVKIMQLRRDNFENSLQEILTEL